METGRIMKKLFVQTLINANVTTRSIITAPVIELAISKSPLTQKDLKRIFTRKKQASRATSSELASLDCVRTQIWSSRSFQVGPSSSERPPKIADRNVIYEFYRMCPNSQN